MIKVSWYDPVLYPYIMQSHALLKMCLTQSQEKHTLVIQNDKGGKLSVEFFCVFSFSKTTLQNRHKFQMCRKFAPRPNLKVTFKSDIHCVVIHFFNHSWLPFDSFSYSWKQSFQLIPIVNKSWNIECCVNNINIIKLFKIWFVKV